MAAGKVNKLDESHVNGETPGSQALPQLAMWLAMRTAAWQV